MLGTNQTDAVVWSVIEASGARLTFFLQLLVRGSARLLSKVKDIMYVCMYVCMYVTCVLCPYHMYYTTFYSVWSVNLGPNLRNLRESFHCPL